MLRNALLFTIILSSLYCCIETYIVQKKFPFHYSLQIAELTSHTARILALSMSPDGETVASIGADETMQLWKCFQVKCISLILTFTTLSIHI